MASFDWIDARKWLVALTYDLRPSQTTSSDTLLAARKDIALAILSGQYQQSSSFGCTLPYDPGQISLPASRWVEFDNAKPVATPTLKQRILRTTLGLHAPAVDSRNRSNLDSLFGLEPSITHGPFLDDLDRPVYVDVFKPVNAQEHAFPIVGQPAYMYVAAPITSTGHFQATLGAGTVWIRADLLTASNPTSTQAPPDCFFGLRIVSGVMTTPPVSTVPRSLKLKLDGSPTTSREFSITPVAEVSFSFRISNSTIATTISAIGSGDVTVFGSSLRMQQSSFDVTFDGSLGRLNFAMASDSSTFQPAPNASGLMDISGTCGVQTAAWSVIVKRSPDKTFYAASSPGGFAISLNEGMKMGIREEAVLAALDICTLIVDPQSAFTTRIRANTSMRSRNVAVGKTKLERDNGMNSLTFRPEEFMMFYYLADVSGTESWTIKANMSFALDQPRTVNSERMTMEAINGSNYPWTTMTWLHESNSQNTLLNIQAVNTLPRKAVSFALKNLLIMADIPQSIDIAGEYARGAVLSARVRMVSMLRYTLPFLPDPYVTNFEPSIDPVIHKNGMGYLTILERWSEQIPPALDLDMMTELAIPARTMERNKDSNYDDPALGDIRKGKYWGPARNLLLTELESGLIPDLGVGQLFHIPDKPNDGHNTSHFHPPTLLDVSSSSSQFGIVFGTTFYNSSRRDANLEQVANLSTRVQMVPSLYSATDFRISNLMLESGSANVRIMGLPACHWEPVWEADVSTVPATLGAQYRFQYSGPSTQIAIKDTATATPSVRLVPVAPREAIESLIGTYNSRTSATVATRCSLPFGMVAVAEMENTSSIIRRSAQVNKIEFTLGGEEDPKTKLKSSQLQPADQIWFKPPRPQLANPIPFPIPAPGCRKLTGHSDLAFPGSTILLKLENGPKKDDNSLAELMDPATDPFNSDMKSQVPLLRFDISGYGATIFSDWKRVLGPTDREPAITNALLNVINGRTSREVIQLQNVMAAFAVTVVKTIEIKRLNSGVVVRHESDWHAMSDGAYFYKNPDIVTHPGIIRGVTNVRNIRDVGGTVTPKDPDLPFRKVQFDCIVEIEDQGQVHRIPGRNLDGCVLLKDPTPDTYSKLLNQVELGGHIDVIVDIGKSGQKKRITSIAVKPGLDSTSGKQVAVAAALGSPIFPGGGQWSFARMLSDGQPQPVDLAKGVPLVKQGRHDEPNLSSVPSPYMFRNPQDLLSGTPETVYGIIHGAASHRVLFSSPEIPFVQDAKKGIESANVWVADSLALGNSKGIFPNVITDCLPVKVDGLPDAKQFLEIVREEGYKFEPKRILDGVPVPQLELDDLSRTIKDDAGVKTIAQVVNLGKGLGDAGKDLAGDVLQLKSTLSLAINTVDNISKMDVTNIHMVTKTVKETQEAVERTAKEASRVIGRLSSDVKKIGGLLGADLDPDLPHVPKLPNVAQDVIHKFGPALDQVQSVLSFLENLKFLPNFKVSMTNEWGMVMSTSMNREDLLKKIPPSSGTAVAKIIDSFDFILSATMSLAAFLLKMHVGTTIRIPTGFGPIVAIGKGAFDVALGTGAAEVKLELGFGIGVEFGVGPFSASASFTQSQTILFHDDVFGVGITACMRAHVDLVIASADLYLEARLLVVGGECTKHTGHDATTIWAFAQVKIAIHVSIFLICNIGVEEDSQWENRLNGGPCELDDMSSLVPGLEVRGRRRTRPI